MLAGLKEIIAEGQKRNIAIGSFNTPNLECLLAVLDAAEELITISSEGSILIPLSFICFSKFSQIFICIECFIILVLFSNLLALLYIP